MINRLLLPFSLVYGIGVRCRNAAFDLGVLSQEDAGAPVISVGNLTAGGTGKTPLVECIAGYLLSLGKRPAVVSRGYGRWSSGLRVVADGASVLLSASEAGDEPIQIARKLPGVIVVVAERRAEAARQAVKVLGANVVIMDDGFQHRYLRRDLNIVVLDARKPIARELLLPAGLRREPLSALKRADLIALSKLTTDQEWHRTALPAGIPVVSYRYKVAGFRKTLGGALVPLEQLTAMRLTAFSGIGDHPGFLSTAAGLGLAVTAEREFADHHWYTAREMEELQRLAARGDAAGLVTTEKDAVRILANREAIGELRKQGARPLFHIEVALEFIAGEDMLHGMIDRVVGEKVPQ